MTFPCFILILFRTPKLFFGRKFQNSSNVYFHRSISLLYESERTGQATAEELLRQKEQLKQTESRLTDINSTLKQSERHLQGIKSVFGGIRNYFKGGPPAGAAPGVGAEASSGARMSASVSAGAAADSALSRANDIRY